VTIIAALVLAAALPFAVRADDNDKTPPPPPSSDQPSDKDQAPPPPPSDDQSSDKKQASVSANDSGGRERHPAYLHALADLRAARWMIKHRHGDWKVAQDEDEAWRDIEKAIGEIKHAAIDDGKNLDDHPTISDEDDHAGRLHKALDLLRKTRDDLSRAEENGHARGLRRRAFRHIDHAIEHVRSAIHAAEHEHDRDDDRGHRHHHGD
jgi:hypothetical protein